MSDRRLESARTPDGPGPTPIEGGVGPDHLRVVLGTTPGPPQDQGPFDLGFLVDEWAQRLEAAVAQTIAARQARRDQRATLTARRAVGLDRRHAAKLTRNQGDAA